MRKIRVIFSLSLMMMMVSGTIMAQTMNSSEILHELKKLKFNGTVLYIAAHPDDENTRLIAWMTNDLKADVSYLSLTRGDGGQNLIGTEIGEGLGLLRTNELLGARKIDGGTQYFTRAIDFGYSKTPSETYENWNKDKVLSDMVKVIRQMKPDVIITRFSAEENPDRRTHGHHTASAQLAAEAMAAASDPTQFTHQLMDYGTWTTKKMYWNTSWWFWGSRDIMKEKVAEAPEKFLAIDVNSYLPLTGKYCSEISALSRSQHKSQGFGSSPVVGDQIEYLEYLSGLPSGSSLFDGIATSWSEAEGGKPVASQLDKVISKFNPEDPSASLDDLFELKSKLDAVPNDNKWKPRAIKRLKGIIMACLGVQINAETDVQHLYSGEQFSMRFDMDEPEAASVQLKVRSGSFQGLDAVKDFNPQPAEGKYTQLVELKIPANTRKSQPYWLEKTGTKGSYAVTEENVGKAFNNYPFYLHLILEVNGRELDIEIPVVYASSDPVKGRVVQPLIVRPDVMMNLNSEVMIFPNSNPKDLEVKVIAGKPGMEGYLELNLPDGWKCKPAFHKLELENKGDARLLTFSVIPPEGASSASIRAIFKTETVYSNSLRSLQYDHVPEWDYYPTSELEVRRLDLKLQGKRIAYIPGAGDKVADNLRVMGFEVDEHEATSLTETTLSGYDAVVVGIRAYNRIEEIGNVNKILNAYVNGGGTVVVQYNTSHRLKSEAIGPYELKLGRGRVTEEDAKVNFLAPNHAVLNTPNKITSADFDNWVQERGLYFPSEWSDEFTPILGMADKGSEELQGSLLVSTYGKGHFVYTGISFFRELPAGVPGAYRLMANILALGN